MASVTETQREWARIYMGEPLDCYRKIWLASVICPERAGALRVLRETAEDEFQRPVSVLVSLSRMSRNMKSYIEVPTSNPFLNRKVRLYELRDALDVLAQKVDKVVCEELLGW